MFLHLTESTSKLLWAKLEDIYLKKSQPLQEIQDFTLAGKLMYVNISSHWYKTNNIALITFFEDFFVFPAPITSEQLRKELNSFIYPEFEAKLLVSTFCGGQEIPTPLSDSSVTRLFAFNLLKNLLESRKQKINQSSNNGLFLSLLDRTSRGVVEWWRLCLSEQVGKFLSS